MVFHELLNNYMSETDCSAKVLAQKTKVSESTISRYRRGERLPEAGSDAITQISNALAEIALEKGLTELTSDSIYESLNRALLDYKKLANVPLNNFSTLVDTLDIVVADLANYMKYDASFLYYIRSGKRRPADIEKFVSQVSLYIAENYTSDEQIKLVTDTIGADYKTLVDNSSDKDYYVQLLNDFMLKDSLEAEAMGKSTNNFLTKLNDFNLQDFIHDIHFDTLKVPTVPFQIVPAKNYFNIEGMREAEIDFFKSTVLSKSNTPVFMCCDMPMEDMAEDKEWSKKWMFGLAMMLKKGLTLNIVHNLDRPFPELMLGLEGWIPLYMTGQVNPFYMENSYNGIYGHLTYTSGQVALTGECITDFHADGKYYITRNKSEVSYYQKRAEQLLSKAKPLMTIFTADEQTSFLSAYKKRVSMANRLEYTLSTQPLSTIPKDLLISMLKRHSIDEETTKKIIEHSEFLCSLQEEFLAKGNELTYKLPNWSKEEFKEYAPSLALASLFLENEITYTYEEYTEHLKATHKFAVEHDNLTVIDVPHSAFRNIQFLLCPDNWVLVSKNKAACVHFLIDHPTMVYAIQNYSSPITDNE